MAAPRKSTKPAVEQEGSEVSADADIPANLSGKDVEETIDEAKRGFRLRDRLKGFKGSTKKHVLFFNLEAADAAAAAQNEVERTAMMLENTRDRFTMEGKVDDEGTPLDDDTKNLLDIFERAHEKAKATYEPLYAEAIADALQFTLRYLPQKEVDFIDAEAKKALGLKYNERPEEGEQTEEFNLVHTKIAMRRAITEVKDAEGNVSEALEAEDIDALREDSPATAWRTLVVALNGVLYSNQFAKLATDDAGF